MILMLCAWRATHRRPALLRVARWWRPWPIVRSHGICSPCRRNVMVIEPLRRVATRLRTTWYLGLDARLEIARDIDVVIRRLEKGATGCGTW